MALQSYNSKLSRQETEEEQARRQREILAGFCRLLSESVLGKEPGRTSPGQGMQAVPPLSPRVRQTLELLLAGDSEKQIAAKLKISQHTVHDYVKRVYRQFGVGTRAELLALWVRK